MFLASSRAALPSPRLLSLATLRLQHTLTELPKNWRKLDYKELEVFDTSELRSLQSLLEEERERVVGQRTLAKEQQRKVLRVDCDLDLKRIDRINKWLDHIYKDVRRTW